MLERLDNGDRISLGGAVVLLIGLFLPWYGIDTGALGSDAASQLAKRFLDGVSANAFKAFDVLDIVLLLLAVGAGAVIVLVALGKLDRSLHRHVETIGGAAAVAVLFRMVIRPGDIDLSLKWGIFVSLIGAVAVAAGQFLSRTGRI